MITQQFLDFEQPIAELEAKIEELRLVSHGVDFDLNSEIDRLKKRAHDLTAQVFKRLSDWQIVQLARHTLRPHTVDYIQSLFTEFQPLHGDRHQGSGLAIVGGLARFQGHPVMVMGHEKGRKTQEKIQRNFGMAKPEDYRKALRLMQLAEKFKLPVFTFIDTPGAYPGIDAEEHNQSEAIARNLSVMARLKVPIIVTVIGEGGSGGALAIGIGDRLLMLEYSIYSVISPEGCASILWKSSEKAAEAAAAMGLTAPRLKSLGLIDTVVQEPLGGAHRDPTAMMACLQQALSEAWTRVHQHSIERLVEIRYQRLMNVFDKTQ